MDWSAWQVVVSDATLATASAARDAGRPLWRVSSTTFVHLASDGTMAPLGRFATPEVSIDSVSPQPCTASVIVRMAREMVPCMLVRGRRTISKTLSEPC